MWADVWFVIFFFKQKTAYEMRISDWSSDVCSSDLPRRLRCRRSRRAGGAGLSGLPQHPRGARRRAAAAAGGGGASLPADAGAAAAAADAARRPHRGLAVEPGGHRSEEHTSELQSLMRNSYAVFCLNKKTINNHLASK